MTVDKEHPPKNQSRPGPGSSKRLGSKDTLTVTLVDPMERGHHVEYASILARELANCGVRVDLVGSDKFVRQVASHAQVQNIHVASYKPGKGLRAELGKRRFLRDASLFASKSESDILHLLFLDRFLFAAARTITGLGRTRFTATLHWAYFSGAFPQRLQNRPVRMFERRLMADVMRVGSRVIVHSKRIVEILSSETGTSGFDVVPYPVTVTPQESPDKRTARQTLGLPTDAKLLLAFGGTRYDKGADIAVRALATLPPEFHLLIAGQPIHFDEESLRALASEHNVQSRVHLHLRFVPNEEIDFYFSAADVVITPYRNTFAGQSGPLVLGASKGVPIVSANILVLAETVASYNLGTLFLAGQPKSLAEAVTRLLTQRFQPNTAAFLRDHSTGAFGRAVLRSYGRTLSKSDNGFSPQPDRKEVEQ